MKHNAFKILFYIFLDGKKIGRYGVISELGDSFRCVNEFTKNTFLINKKLAWIDLEELKFYRWSKTIDVLPIKHRQRSLTMTKKLDYKGKYVNVFPEKLI